MPLAEPVVHNCLMHQLHWNLSILAKAVHHKNLSSAADHVGISQPQLSRIIAKLEEELKVVLLDRSVRRKSGWTKAAFDLAEIYVKSENKLHFEIQSITTNQISATLSVGTLEGLSHLALEFCKLIFKSGEIHHIRLDVFDLSDLEEHFETSDLDIIFSFRVPGRQKYKNVLEIGYQSVNPVKTSNEYLVYSGFEYSKINPREKKTDEKVFVSNSLVMRRYWLENVGGEGTLPGKVSRAKSKGEEPVYLVGSELLSPLLWDNISKAANKTRG